MEPLASQFRPDNIIEFIGQDKIIDQIKKLIDNNRLPSMIFWGPPGTGKTTLAYIISKTFNAEFFKLSAVNSGKAKLNVIVKKALAARKEGRNTILFLDEIHRWNKAQQDSLLPYVEKGIITLIGATTENPSFSLIPALLSRSRVFTFKKHSQEDVVKFLKRILEKSDSEIKIDDKAIQKIAESSDGDLRTAGNIIEYIMDLGLKKVTVKDLQNVIENFLQYERGGEDHYNIISAVHKSLRDSDPDGGVYWVMRMLEAGEDPVYIARRLVRFASEDIGNADPFALVLADTVMNTCKNIGMPEADTALIQLAIYLAKAPKDNTATVAAGLAREDIRKYGSLPVPMHIRNAPTKFMQEEGYGKGYKYYHDHKDDPNFNQQHLPDELKDRKYVA
jgi:putative ATPase